MLIYTTIKSLDVRKIELALFCFFFSLPVPPWDKEKRLRHFGGFYRMCSVAIKWYRTVKLQIALKIQDIRDAWCWNSHSILKLSVFRIIAHFTISAEIEKIRKLKIPSVIEKNCKHTYYYTDRSYHENPTCSNISRLIKFSGWRKMFVYKL